MRVFDDFPQSAHLKRIIMKLNIMIRFLPAAFPSYISGPSPNRLFLLPKRSISTSSKDERVVSNKVLSPPGIAIHNHSNAFM
jgi:hypothetical protein